MRFAYDIEDYIEREVQVLRALSVEEIDTLLNILLAAYERDASIYIMGNGGSAATASHFCCDFNKGVSGGLKKKFRFISLTDNVPTILALANDVGYEDIFALQLENVLEPDDVVIGISGSGNSPNVLKAIEYANAVGSVTVGITGYDGGKLRKLARHSVNANIDDMQISEDIHMVLDHMMMKILYRYLNERG